MKRMRFVALSLVLVLLLSAAPAIANADGVEQLSGTVTISMAFGGGITVWEEIVKKYNEFQPNVTVVLDDKESGSTYTDWLSNQLAAGELNADIVTNNVVAKYIQDRRFVDYNEYLAMENPYMDYKLWEEGLNPAVMRPNGPDDGVYSLNIDSVQVLWFYNKAIFEEVGVEPPSTWDELIEVCEKIKAAGYTPIGISGNAQSFWEMTMGWLMRIYSDQYMRDFEPLLVAQPDDYNYDPDKNDDWAFDPTDIENDTSAVVKFNSLRAYRAILDGTLTPNSEKFREMYENLAKVFPEYAPEGFFGMDLETAESLFINGEAAMRVDGAWFAAGFEKTMKDAPEPFELGYFWSPKMEGEHVAVDYTRSLGGPNGFLGVVNHSKEQVDLAMDFMMFYASPIGQEVRYQAMLDNDNSPSGPSLVYDVKMPDKWAEIFESMGYNGECDNNPANLFCRGLSDEQESVRAWTEQAQNYFLGKITVQEFSEVMEEIVIDAIPRVIANNGWRADCLDDVTADPEELR